MKIKEVMHIGMAIILTIVLQQYFGSRKQNDEVISVKPLNKEVDFFDKRRLSKYEKTEIIAEWGAAIFSTDGACLESIDFKHEVNGKLDTIRTIFPMTDFEREDRCFLVVLNEKTPFYYSLESVDEKDYTYELVYNAETDDAIINKTFIVGKKNPKIDLRIDLKPKRNALIQARIFYPSPVMPEMEESDVISSIVIDQSQEFVKKTINQLDMEYRCSFPTLFGADSRYIVHALISDDNKFAQYAYYKMSGKGKLLSIIEGPENRESQSWNLSFYLGPKKIEYLAQVDNRLEKTLDYYGWFAPVARVLLAILIWLYSLFHNYGLAIIVLTVLFKLMLLPITMRGEQRMKQQQELQKKMSYLQQRYKDDQQKLNIERAELIRKHGLPGLGGCLLPLVVQTPIFISLSRVLSSSIELYKAPMLWISDLSAKDPYYIFPLLVFIGMIGQARQADAQQRASLVMLGLVLGAFTAYLSAGLALYICVSSLLGTLQTRLVKYLKIVR